MTNPRYRFATALLLAALTLTGLGCKGGSQQAQQALAQPVTLQWWGTQPIGAGVAQLANDFTAIHPNVTVSYRQLKSEEFESTLLRALAAGQGPDIISLPNTSLRAWQAYLTPLPASLSLPFIQLTGWIKKEPTAVIQSNPTMTVADFRNRFLDVAASDAIIDNKIYGVPLSLDSLLLYYNRDLLSAAGYATPPATWTDFKDASQKITRVDKQGHLLQDGAALGLADNIPNAFDILSALMLQNNTPMTSGSSATFNQPITVGSQTYVPGADAVRFYTDFANPSKETFSWSAEEPTAFQAFASGKLGFVFGYWRDYQTLKALAPQINIGVANFPQIDGTSHPTYYASYFVQAVTKQSTNLDEAWGLLHFAVRDDEIGTYLKAAKEPAAHRSQYQDQAADPDLGVVVKQSLTAKTWYRGFNPQAAMAAFGNLIRQAAGGTPLDTALQFAAQQVSQTLQAAPL